MYSNKLICQILNYIDTNWCNKLSINDLENKFYYNRYYIMKLFKREIGVTIFDYVNNFKIYKSINEIAISNNSMITIAINCGFNSLEYFSETFKNIVGVSPSNYKKILNREAIFNIDKYDEVTLNIIKINKLINKVNVYKNNIKSDKIKVKKLTIFSS
ncbi:MAG: helix-turn-helix transcriptional regulator [Erysipelotrichaceae bacterium]|nr:helix-turn-helix transcriptional regulator [Erysipelotrichaceae bacterium]